MILVKIVRFDILGWVTTSWTYSMKGLVLEVRVSHKKKIGFAIALDPIKRLEQIKLHRLLPMRALISELPSDI